jgi:hypothetical protein
MRIIAAVEAMYFVCSYSSGIPEAGGDAAFYFDPTSLPSFEQTLLAALRRLRFERAAIRAASRRQALRFTWHDSPAGSTRRSPPQPRHRPMLNAPEIIGLSEPCADGGFELIDVLRRPRQAEIARITGIAMRLTARFGAETAVGFLYYEILRRPPDREDLLGYAERLDRTPSMAPIMVEELLALSRSQQ